MSKTFGFFMAASAVLFFSAAGQAAENTLLALNTAQARPALAIKSAELLQPATGQVKAADIGTTDFDALSEVNDPLYREGSKEFLQQEVKQDAVNGPAKTEVKQPMRDAPISKSAVSKSAVKGAKRRPSMKKPGAKKIINADPVKVKDTL